MTANWTNNCSGHIGYSGFIQYKGLPEAAQARSGLGGVTLFALEVWDRKSATVRDVVIVSSYLKNIFFSIGSHREMCDL